MKLTRTLLAAALMMSVAVTHAAEGKHASCIDHASFAKSVAMSRDAGMPAHQIIKNVQSRPPLAAMSRKVEKGIPKRTAANIVASVYDDKSLTPDEHAQAAYNTCMGEAS